MEFIAKHWLDIVTTVLGLAYILFEYRASVWMWLVGFMMQALGIVLYDSLRLLEMGSRLLREKRTTYPPFSKKTDTALARNHRIGMVCHLFDTHQLHQQQRSCCRQLHHSLEHHRNMGIGSQISRTMVHLDHRRHGHLIIAIFGYIKWKKIMRD